MLELIYYNVCDLIKFMKLNAKMIAPKIAGSHQLVAINMKGNMANDK